MATLLYRIGRSAARHTWRVVIAWAALLILAVGSFFAFGGALASTFSIPGTETSRVSDQLVDELGTSGSTGTVVFHTDDGSAFTDGQRAQVGTAMDQVADLADIPAVVDPFAAEAERADQEQELADGAQEAAQGQAALEENQTELAAGLEMAEIAGAPESEIAELSAQLEEVTIQLATLEAQSAQLELGEHLSDFAAELQTVSTDGSTALGVVVFDGDAFSVPEDVKNAVIETLEAADLDGVSVEFASEIASSVEGLVGPAEIIGLVVAALVLLVMFQALRPAGLPIVSSLTGVGIGVAGSLALSDVIEMNSVTPVLGLMLGLAVGIDYSLFIINRHRRQMRTGMHLTESIGLANGTAGGAVVFAGATVIIALLALNTTGITFLGLLGSVGAVCVFIAVLVATTLTPALLGLLGDGVLTRRGRAAAQAVANGDGGSQSHRDDNAAMPTLRAVLTVIAAVVALLVIAIPALSMRLGLPDGSSEAEDSTQYRAYTLTAEHFGAGQNGPLVVAATLPEPMTDESELQVQVDIAGTLMDLPEVVAVAPAGISADRDFVAFQVIPVDGPSSESTEDLVHTLRDMGELADGVQIGVAGSASGNIDISDRLADALPLYLVVVVGLSMLILVVVFRSLVVPVLATVGFLFSLFAALGAMTAVYQWGWLGSIFGVHDPGPLLNFAPLIIIGVLFGLAMDYQLFMVSGMREAYVHGLPARRAVTAGFHNGRAVVTAAAIIMIAVFGGFTFSHLAMVRPLGFGLAIGVLFDAFVVRMALIPAAMHLLGKSAWWLPKWLDRILPNVDIEGAALERNVPSAGVVASPTSGGAGEPEISGVTGQLQEDVAEGAVR